MSSAKKALKLGSKNKSTRANLSNTTKEKNDDLVKASMLKSSSSGLVVSVHPVWPDIPQNQSKLFFECTLFLYSVLALFLQYLNLYKTLWWLPKSHWHSSMKFYLINPYLLSCIGLLLGMRVTICFWNTVSEKNADVLKSCKGWTLKTFSCMEFAVRFFLLSTVFSSFCFSFSRIVLEFGTKTLLYFGYPICFYVLFFHRQILNTLYQLFFGENWPLISFNFWRNLWTSLSKAFHSNLIDLDSVVHFCSSVPSRNREEAKILLQDFDSRFKSCVFTGIFTAYFSILMPRVFVPEKTNDGETQFFLIDDFWVMQMFTIVAITAFLLYATYLFPIQYIDLMHRCAVHLGHWHRHTRQTRPAIEENVIEFNESSETPMSDETVVIHREEYYQAKAFEEVKTLSAIPGNEEHLRFYVIYVSNDIVATVT